MPLGEATDMGRADDGTPLIDPRIFYSAEFRRNPWPYYRILRDHYPVYFNKLNNTYYVTRYADMTECYYDDIGFNTIPKGSSNGVLGNVTHEFSGVEHRRRRVLDASDGNLSVHAPPSSSGALLPTSFPSGWCATCSAFPRKRRPISFTGTTPSCPASAPPKPTNRAWRRASTWRTMLRSSWRSGAGTPVTT